MDTNNYAEIQAEGNFITENDIARAQKIVKPKEASEQKKTETKEDNNIKRTPDQILQHRKEAISAFQFFDKEGTGFVNSSELRHLFLLFSKNSLTVEQVDNFLMEAELDENGQINYKNFVNLMIK